MRFHMFSLVCSALIVFSVGQVTAQNALALDGRWEGTLPDKPTKGSRELRQPRQLPVVVRISTASDGRYAGEWLIASARRIADIGEIAIDGDAVRIGVPSSSGVWEGKLSSDGFTLAGEWRQGGKTTPLVLRRTGNANEPVRLDSFNSGTVTRR